MFARRVVTSSRAAPISLIRTFASSGALNKSPSLADITPEGVKSFEAKQKAFREKIAAEHKAKATSQSTDLPSPPASSFSTSPPDPNSVSPTAPHASNASFSSNGSSPQTLGSLKTSSAEVEEPESKKGKLSTLIYGTKEGREMDKEMEQSFSKVLARGKYVHSIVFHEVRPDKVDEYVELVGNWYPKMASLPENKVHLVGSWRTEVGDCDTFGTSSTEHLREQV